MIIRGCAFTEKGRALFKKIEGCLPGDLLEIRQEEPLAEWTGESFSFGAPLIFVGACGIAVRAIAPFVKDKLCDSPVLVVDEGGSYVISLLSGHMGGANQLARKLAEGLKACPVITTATDINRLFAVDLFAKENYLRIYNREGIQEVSSQLLKAKTITMAIDRELVEFDASQVPPEIELVSYPPAQKVDVIVAGDTSYKARASLLLLPRDLVLGLGCKKETSAVEIRARLDSLMGDREKRERLAALATIDLKEKEYGLVRFAMEEKLPLHCYSSRELMEVQGSFSHSDFVEQTTGADNVCERAAMCFAGDGARLLCPKQAGNGVTWALAERKVRIREWKTSYTS